MKNILKNLGLLIIVLAISYFLSKYTGDLYSKLFKQSGTWIDLRGLVGLPLVYIFFLILLFTAFGGAKKYWWIGVLLIPALAFELYFDLAHIYFPVALALLGWGIGFGVSKLMKM